MGNTCHDWTKWLLIGKREKRLSFIIFHRLLYIGFFAHSAIGLSFDLYKSIYTWVSLDYWIEPTFHWESVGFELI
jgi:hypothetical protein